MLASLGLIIKTSTGRQTRHLWLEGRERLVMYEAFGEFFSLVIFGSVYLVCVYREGVDVGEGCGSDGVRLGRR